MLKKLDTFQDWKFGFFMHWGIYSQWGCIESWPLVEEDKFGPGPTTCRLGSSAARTWSGSPPTT